LSDRTYTAKGTKDWGITTAVIVIMLSLIIGGVFFIYNFWQSSVLIGVGILLILVHSMIAKKVMGVDTDIFWPLFIALFAVGMLGSLIYPVVQGYGKGRSTSVSIATLVALIGVFLLIWWSLSTFGGEMSIIGFDSATGEPVTLDLWEAIDNAGRGMHVFCLDCQLGDSNILGIILITVGLAGAALAVIYALKHKSRRRK